MSQNKKQNPALYPLKVVIASVALLGFGYWTYSRIFDDGSGAKGAESISGVDQDLFPEIRGGPHSPEQIGKGRQPEMIAKGKQTTEEDPKALKALSWEEYLNYDPLEGRGNPTPELFILSETGSPFFADNKPPPPPNKDPEGFGIPPIILNLEISAILGDPGRRVAVIDGTSWSVGDLLEDEQGFPLLDNEFSKYQIDRITPEGVHIKVGGMTYFKGIERREGPIVIDEIEPK